MGSFNIMIIRYVAKKDPMFDGSFVGYTLIQSDSIEEHIEAIREVVMRHKPDNTTGIQFYSVPDKRGMRFLRITEEGDMHGRTGKYRILSDFKWEWL